MTTTTKQAAHTPGPWDYDGGECCEIIAPTTHVNPHGHGCAQLVAVATTRADLNDGEDGHPERSEDEAHANARLIAAAPELLEACEELVKWMDDSGMSRVNTAAGPSEYSVVRDARAAIAKARP